MRTKSWILGVLAGALIARWASAETASDARWRVDVRPGALAWGSTIDGGSEPAHGAGPAIAVGGGYRLTDHVEVDASAQAAAQGLTLFGRTQSYGSLTAGGRWFPLGSETVVRPWLGGEAGWYHARSTFATLFGSESRSADGGGFNVGTGFDVPVGSRVSIGADVRYHQTLGVFDDPGFVTTLANVSFHFGH